MAMQSVKKLLVRVLPDRPTEIVNQWLKLRRVTTRPCDTSNLRPTSEVRLADVFQPERCEDEWAKVKNEFAKMAITNMAGGVNPGDRRAIYHLIRYLRPARVLEVGTHIGASTVHIAVALRALNADSRNGTHRLVTVDIADVNDPQTQPWIQFGSTHAPSALIDGAACTPFVSFCTGDAFQFMSQSEERYDLIFLDGSHAASDVYREITQAVKALSPGGLLLLHDHYPGLKPLYPDGSVRAGPEFATRRLIREGAEIALLPLGQLPWPTKAGSNFTSLTLLGRKGPVT